MLELFLIFQMLLWVSVLGVFIFSGQASLLHPTAVYLAFHFLAFVLRPILVFTLGFDSIWKYVGYYPTEYDMIKCLAVSSVALVVFVGVNLYVGKSVVKLTTLKIRDFTAIQHNSLIVTTLLLLPIMIYSIYITSTGQGVGTRTANGIYINTNSNGYTNDAQLMMGPLICIWLMRTRFHWLNLIPIALYMVYRVWVGWGRFSIITFCLTITLMYCWYYRRKWIPLGHIILAIPLLILFNTVGHNREFLQDFIMGTSTPAVEYSAGMNTMDKIRAAADTQDFANFDYLTFIVSVVPQRTETYAYGLQYLQLFTEPIPRVLWPGKPVGAPIPTFDINQYGNFLGLTFSIAGDGWSNGGWIGLVLTVGVIATILGYFHRWFWRNSSDSMVALLYISAIGTIFLWYRDGGCISILKFMFWTWLPMMIWLLFVWFMGSMRIPCYSTRLTSGDRIKTSHSE